MRERFVEVWKSSENREERHFFIKGGDVGYQHNTYWFGFNPQLVSEDQVRRILLILEEQ